jgi:hypothetical protein
MTFVSYGAAYDAALRLARSHQRPVAVRRVNEFGRQGFLVRLAAAQDSDDALAEIVLPTDPVVGREVIS